MSQVPIASGPSAASMLASNPSSVSRPWAWRPARIRCLSARTALAGVSGRTGRDVVSSACSVSRASPTSGRAGYVAPARAGAASM